MSKTKFFFTLKAAGGEEESVAPGMGAVSDCAVQHHVLKFNPMDVHAIHELGHEWLFQKDIPPQTDWEKKKKLKNKEAHAEHERKTTWKRPWLISDTKDTEFKKAFLARRETDKKSKLNVIVNVTLTEVKAVCKGDEDLKRRLASTNNALAQLYKACEEAACGPGTDVFDMDVTTKKRAIDDKDTYKVTSMLVRIPAAHLKVLEEKQKEEAQLTKDFAKENKDKLGKGVIDWNGTIIQFKVDEIGRKQHSFFWLEARGSERDGDTRLLLRPVHGDWWSVRKDATRRGVEPPVIEGEEPRRRQPAKKEKEVDAPHAPKSKVHQRLLAKTEDARIATLEQGSGQGGSLMPSKLALSKKLRRGQHEGEDGMKQQWREESHDVDDEMDAQQCGDIDDEDYDNAQAAAGDDLALNPDDIQKALYEDVADEVVKEMSDESSDEEMNTHLALDEAGKEMDRIVTGKPVKSKDDKNRERSSSPEESSKMQVDDDKDKGSSASKPQQKVGSIKVKLPSSSSLGKRPDGSQAGGPAKKAKPAPAPVPTDAEMRAAIAADPHMCVKKLIEKFKIKTMGAEQQNQFLTTMKGMCLKTKKLVPEGPFKDQAIIQLKAKPPVS